MQMSSLHPHFHGRVAAPAIDLTREGSPAPFSIISDDSSSWWSIRFRRQENQYSPSVDLLEAYAVGLHGRREMNIIIFVPFGISPETLCRMTYLSGP